MGDSRSSSAETPIARAAIFDLDGLLVDSEPVHMQTWRLVMGRRGVAISDDVLQSIIGVSDAVFLERFLAENGLDGSVDEWLADKRCTYLELIRDGVSPFPGAVELVKTLAARIPAAIATSASADDVAVCVEQLDLGPSITATVTREDVASHKPAPDCFLLAAQRLGVGPADCVVFEDSLAGVEAARRAGMRCVAVTNSFARDELTDATLVVDSLAETKAIWRLMFGQ